MTGSRWRRQDLNPIAMFQFGLRLKRISSSLLVRRPAWCLTWRGWVLLLGASFLTLAVCGRFCGDFLTYNERITAQVLIVEGWLPDYALKDAVEEFHSGGYRYVITAGSPLIGGYYNSSAKTSAHLAATALVTFGLATNLVVPVPGPPVMRERSYFHAKAVHEWLQVNDPSVRSVNVYSLGVHARRTRLLFAKVMGSSVRVGSIAHPDATYDVGRWWKSSEGFRTVSGEMIAYVWAICFGKNN